MQQRKEKDPNQKCRWIYIFSFSWGSKQCKSITDKTHANDTKKHDEKNQDLEGTAEFQPELTNTEAWNSWKEMMIADQPDMREHGKQLALYMHCMIQ